MTSPKKQSARSARRALARDDEKFAGEAERLARLQPGGSPDLPIEVSSASQVDGRAQSMLCPLCHGALRIEEHVAAEIRGARLRVVKAICSMCGKRRQLYFRIGSSLPN